MGEVIEFPGGTEAFRRTVERVIDEGLEIGDDEVRACAKARVAETLSKYRGLPSLSIAVPVPDDVSDATIRAIAESIQSKYSTEVSGLFMELVKELCIAQARLCKSGYREQ